MPFDSDVVVTLNCVTTVKLSARVADTELASVTRTAKLLVPVPVGVPEITPVLEASDKPAGRVPEAIDQL